MQDIYQTMEWIEVKNINDIKEEESYPQFMRREFTR
jgi:hypothetical protein